MQKIYRIFFIIMILIIFSMCDAGKQFGIFEKAGPVGKLQEKGNIVYIPGENVYRLTGGGDNIWGDNDAFYFAWKKTSGDLQLSARVDWEGEGVHAHRKAGWMVRQNITANSPYADVMVHGDSLIALQYRKETGGPTNEIKAAMRAPAQIRLEKNGHLFTLSVAGEDSIYLPVGSVLVPMADTVYTGLAVCSHRSGIFETAEFSDVQLKELEPDSAGERIVESSLEIINIKTEIRKLVYRAKTHFEAPNWSVDGKYLLFNSQGLLYTIPVTGGVPEHLNTESADNCNNDHGFSPDGGQIAISHSPQNQSLIYIMPATGGEPMQITRLGPSYWHGWSPDGNTLAYCAMRNGEYDVYTISVTGGPESRLTSATGLDDGPEYSPDGQYIYFNSERSGLMKIWRMNYDGKMQVQITDDPEFADWFPHPSPDGKWIVFLSYNKEVQGHPPNQEVSLRLMDVSTNEIGTVARFFGGQGTINVPSWSPDSKSFAFVSYRLVYP